MERAEALSVLSFLLARGSSVFGGSEREPESAVVLVTGIPFEATTSYLPGTRLAPQFIREASANIEFYSLRAGLDVDEVPIADLGDVAPTLDVEKMLDTVSRVAEALAAAYSAPPDRLPVYLGGEHTVTLGILRGLTRIGLPEPPCVVSLDAHLDMRDEYLGQRLGHANVMRRAAELVGAERIAVIGARAFAREEFDYAAASGAVVVDVAEARGGPREAARRVLKRLSAAGCGHLHLTVDMDVFDPGFAPGVGNPEPEGLAPGEAFDMIHEVIGEAVRSGLSVSVDVVELSPPGDCGRATSALAAKTVVEAIAAWYVAKRR
ncbi:MAG: agmatinase [Crenarchaeota archaeon]|nr:agmatinase [Thermoproteota archaeon]